MFNQFLSKKRWIEQVHTQLDKLLSGLTTYALPLIIALFSLTALLAWDTHYSAAPPKTVPFKVLEQTGGSLSAAQAVAELEKRPLVSHLDTNRSEAPFWFSFTVPSGTAHDRTTVELPSRHATQVQCWDANQLTPLGHGDRQITEGSISLVKSGFGLTLANAAPVTQILCQAAFVGPARLSVDQWPTAQLQISSDEYHRKSGLLDGGLVVLALFMLVTAMIVRQSRYLLFAAWLLVNLRMGALSAGWDTQWLGHTVPHDWILRIRLLTVATYFVLTTMLFTALFREDLARVGSRVLLRFLHWMCLPLLILSATLPYKTFLPFLWIASGGGVAALLFLLVQLLRYKRSPAAIWYSASLCVTLLGSLAEVLSAAFGMRGLITAANSVTAALSSSLLAALAIAEQMRQEHAQRIEAQAELEHTYEAMPIGMFTLDTSGRFMSANPALIAMLGSNVLDPERNAWERYFNRGSLSELIKLVHAEADGELEIQNDEVAGDGQKKRFLVKATLARGKIEGSLQDITDKSKAIEELRFMANNDPLTKVFNRRGIEKMLDSAMQQLAEGKPLAVAYLDLDRFKLINGLYGHAAGDEVLRKVCSRVTNMLTGTQQIGRVGGDEFIIVLPDTPIELAAWTCRGIVNRIGTVPYQIGDKAFQLRASIGLIEVSPGTQIKDAVATADRACREAKRGNSGGLVVYDKSASAFREREAEFQLMERLSTHTAPLGLFLDMQPIMSLKTPHGSLNFEVLLRMRDHDGSVIPAGRIVAAAENSGRTGVIDRWVMSTTLSWIDTHFARLARTEFVCMNLSGASLNDERFVQDAFVMLEQNPRAASRLCIEITESVALHDMGNTRRFIDKVRSCGVKVALDDFGAGYTSFSYLKELPADVLKIDGSLVVNMNSHPANIAIVEAIVSLARSLGMQTIGEWAEDNATVETLAEIGVDHVQGYAVTRPQPPEKILAAASAASFIQDEQLTQFVRTLGEEQLSIAQMDLLGLIDAKNLH